MVNPLNAKLIPICHLLALVGAHHILHVSKITVEEFTILVNQYLFSTIICSFVLGKINSKQQKTETCDKNSPFFIQLKTDKCFKEWKYVGN
jgi:hypothetical protein